MILFFDGVISCFYDEDVLKFVWILICDKGKNDILNVDYFYDKWMDKGDYYD